jgi:hypothetical protein
MSEVEENKETVIATVNTDAKHEYKPGNRGELGVATASKTIKRQYHLAHFDLVDAEDKRNPNKKRWVKHPKAPSLKKFAHELASQGDIVAKNWFEQKGGALNAKRSDANEALTVTIAAATRLSHRKSSAGGKK